MFATRFVDIPPLEGIGGSVRVPGSKSISNRALLLAGFASGTTAIDGLLHSDDTRVMLDALVALGCRFETGAGPLAVAAAAGGSSFELRGTPRMHERPIGDLVAALRRLGCTVEYLEREGF